MQTDGRFGSETRRTMATENTSIRQTRRIKPWAWGVGALVLAAVPVIIVVAITATGKLQAQKTGNDCAGLSDDQASPSAAPNTTWESYGDSPFMLPTSDEFGPLDHDGAMPRCFAHSPTGAAYAAANLAAAFSIGKEIEAAADSPEAKKQLEAEKLQGENGIFMQPEGFRIESYTEAGAEVTLYATKDTTKGAFTYRLVWDDDAGDWRLDMTAPPQYDPDPQASDFVMWK